MNVYQQAMLLALQQRPMYGGTVPRKIAGQRLAKAKAAKAARKTHRRNK